MTATPKAYSYIRFSTPDQQAGDSFRRQFELSKAYAESHDLILDEKLTYRDLGISAFDQSNVRSGELGAFLAAVESGAVEPGSYLLVESLDRLSRAQMSDALGIFNSILSRGITIVTLADGMEYSTEKVNKDFTGLITSIVIMSRAHEESLTKSRRIKAAWKAKRANIGTLKLTATAPAWLTLDPDRKAYQVIPERKLLVQNMFAWVKDGIGVATISKRLNQQGVPTFNDRIKSQWYTSYVMKILDNRAVLGEFQPHTTVNGKRVPEGDPIPDYFPRIVSDDEFMLALSARKSRRVGGSGRKGIGFSNLFSRILRCGYCNGPMQYVNKGSNAPRSKLLVCSRAKAGKDCYYVPWEYAYFEKSVLTFCKGLDLEAFLQPSDGIKSEMAKLSSRIIVLQTSIFEADKKLSNVLEAIEAGAKFQQIHVRVAQLEDERVRLDAELNATKKMYEQWANAKVDVQAVQTSIDSLIQKMDKLTGEELYDLRAMLSQHVKRLITRITMYPGGYIEKKSFVAGLREHLINAGKDAATVDNHITEKLNIEPNPAERFFTMISPSAAVRVIRPDMQNPEILQLDVPGDDVKNNMASHGNAFGAVFEKLAELASKSSSPDKIGSLS